MEHVVLVIHLILAVSIIGLVLLQRSEGGGLGIGGSGGLGGLASPGATANALTRATAFCAAFFFATSLILGVIASSHGSANSILNKLDQVAAPAEAAAAAETTAAPAEGAPAADAAVPEPGKAKEETPATPSVPVE